MTTTSASSRPWSPSDRDRMIYRWVKFEGHKQSWVADQLDLNQSTVSRIIDRYERWIAHGGPAQQGALNRDERLRAQLWLNYERNEWIIASSMRIANEMEQQYESSKSTIQRDMAHPSQETKMATTTAVVDRSAIAARYLRLANRVGKDQLEVLKQLDLPALEPFTLDPNEYSQALADSRSGFQSGNSPFEQVNVVPSLREGQEAEGAFQSHVQYETPEPPTSESHFSNLESQISSPPPPLSRSPSSDPRSMPAVHNAAILDSQPNPSTPTTSVQTMPAQKSNPHAYALPQNPPGPTPRLDPIVAATVREPLPPIRISPS